MLQGNTDKTAEQIKQQKVKQRDANAQCTIKQEKLQTGGKQHIYM